MGMEFFESLIEILFVILIILAVFFLILHIFSAIGLMGLCKQTQLKNKILAWVPLLNVYLVGKIGINKMAGMLMIILLFVGGGAVEVNGKSILTYLMLPPFFSVIAGIAFFILYHVALYKLYYRFSDKAVIMIILTILSMDLLAPIFLFAIRRNPDLSV